MIGSIVRTALRFRLLVIGIAVGLMIVGVSQLRSAPADVLPEFTPPYVEIQTEALGLSAQEVEQLVTVPLEADLLNGVQGVDTIRSKSVSGLSSIVMVFDRGTDLYQARQLVQERLTQVGAAAFPNVSKPPTLLQPLSSSSRVLMIGLSSKSLSPIEKSVIARWTVRPRLMGVPGVANVSIWGQRDQQLQVQVDPKRLRDKGVTLRQIIDTSGNAQVASPISYLEASTPGTGGFIETPRQRLQVRNVFDKIASPAELAKVSVEGTGGKLRLGDVSNIKVDHQPLIGDAIVGDGEGLLLVVEKFPGANTLDVTRGVEGALDKLRPGLAGIETDTSVFRPASFIEDAIDNLTLTIAIGAALALLALVAFLLDWRSVLVSVVTVPVALTAAAVLLDLLGESFNAISFAGLALALLVVLDDAVAGVENVARRLREDREAGGAKSLGDVVVESAQAIRSPLTYGTLIALLAIVPIVVMEGRPGAFFDPLVLAYALAIGASLVTAMTLGPALAFLLFSRGRPPRREAPLVRALLPRYGQTLARAVRRPPAVLVAAGVALLLGLLTIPLFDVSLIPTLKDKDVLVRLDAQPGTSNPRMVQISRDLGTKLRGIDGVENVGSHVGRAVTGDQVVDVNSSELWVSIDSGADYDATLASIEKAVEGAPAVGRDVVTYSAQKIRDVGAIDQGDNPATGDGLAVLTGSDKPLVVRVYGQNLDTLRTQAERVKQIVSQVDGVKAPRVDLPAAQPEVQIETDLNRSRGYGIKPGDVRRAEAALLQGIQVGSVFVEQKVFDVIVQGVPQTRGSVGNIRNLLIDTPNGGHVPLGEVADVRVGTSPVAIERDAVSRRVDVEANVDGRGLADVKADVEKRLAGLTFPAEYHAEVLKDTANEEIGAGRILAFAIGAAIAAFLLLQAAFRNWPLALAAFLALPVALVGGAIAALIAGAELTVGSLIGFLALYGFAARAALVLFRHLQERAREQRDLPITALVERGAPERLGATLTTTAVAALAVLPFAVAGSQPGLEIVSPMAVVILGGLVTTALLSLFVLPALYVRAGVEPPELEPEEDVLYPIGDEKAAQLA
jgi:CzcA family heavy metal efflux pump